MEYQTPVHEYTSNPPQAINPITQKSGEDAGGMAMESQEKAAANVTRLYGRDLEWYRNVMRKSVWYGGVCAVTFTTGSMLLPGIWADGADVASFIVKLVVWGVIGRHALQCAAYHVGTAAMAAGLAGITIGFVLALVRFFMVQEAWTLFNLVIEPVITGIFGYLIGGAVAYAVKPSMKVAIVSPIIE